MKYSYKNFVMPDDCLVFPRAFFEDSWIEVLSYEYQQLLIYGWTHATVAGFWHISPKDTRKINFANANIPVSEVIDNFVKVINFDNKERCVLINNNTTIFFTEYLDTHRCGTLVLSVDSDAHIYRELVANGISEAYIRNRYNIVDELSDEHAKRLTAQISENIRKKVRVGQRTYDGFLDFNIVPIHEARSKISHNERILYYNNLVHIYYEAAKDMGKFKKIQAYKAGQALFHIWFLRYYESDYSQLVNFVMDNKFSKIRIELGTIINCRLYAFPSEKWAEQIEEAPLVRLPDQQ